MLRYRLLAAVLGLPLLIALLWLNYAFRIIGSPDDFPLLFVMLLIAGASGWEVSNVVRHRYPEASPWNGVYAALILPFIVHAIRLATVNGVAVPVSTAGLLIDSLGSTAALMLLFLGIWSDIENRGGQGIRENIIVLLSGVYLGVAFASLLLLGQTSFHEIAVAFVLVLVFGLDTVAYFGGKTFGGPPLAPHISPSKTVSGAVCGLLGALVLALLVKAVPLFIGLSGTAWWNIGAALSWGEMLWMGFTIGILGQIGDLVESYLKRWGGVKDSGTILPGHGGFLDRFDSLLLAAPAYYLLLIHFLHVPVK